MNRSKQTKATLHLIKCWPKPPSRLAAQLRIAGLAPSQALARRLAH